LKAPIKSTNKRFFFRKEHIGFIVYDKLTSEVFLVNKTGKIILEFFNKGYSEKEIVNKLSEKYKISKKLIKSDLKPIYNVIK